MEAVKKKIPSLRFPGYEGEWISKKLSDVSVFLDGKRKPIKESERTKMKGHYPYYGASGVIDYVNDYIFDDELILLGEDGENIVSRNLPLAFKVSGKCWINNHAHVIKPFVTTDIDFLTQSLENISYIQYNTGTAQPKLNQEVCSRILLHFPSITEQSKIASFLTAVDDKIQHLTRKKELLEQYKKGVMQKIFDREIRFRRSLSEVEGEEGQEYPEWQEKSLGETAKIVGGGTPDTANDIYWDGEISWFTPTEIKCKYITKSKRCISQEGLRNSSAKLLPPGTLLFTSRATIGDVGINILECCTNQGFQSFIVNNQCSNEFLYYWIIRSKSEFLTRANGSTFLEIGKSEISQIHLGLPCYEEQQKIASFLSTIDQKITLVARQLENMQTWKKGLLQKMFV